MQKFFSVLNPRFFTLLFRLVVLLWMSAGFKGQAGSLVPYKAEPELETQVTISIDMQFT